VTIGSSIFMVVAGAILRYAVTWRIRGVDLSALGLILAIAGIATLVIRLIWLFNPELGARRHPLDPPTRPGGWTARPPRTRRTGPTSSPVPTGPRGWPRDEHLD
jgi:hypothetical protein